MLRLAQSWKRLVEPAASLEDPEIRHLSTNLNSVLISILPMTFVLGIIVLPILTDAPSLWESTTFFPTLFVLLISILTYVLNRRGYFHAAGAVYVLMFIVAPILVVMMDSGSTTLPLMALTVGGVLLATTLFHSRRNVLIASAGAVASVLLVPLIAPFATVSDVVVLLFVNVGNCVVILVFAVFRDHLEAERKRILEQAVNTAEEKTAALAAYLVERNQAQAERETLIADLEAKNAELERFTYTVSHDLKSPLITMRGFLGYIMDDAVSGNWERLAADIERITNATDRMYRLLDDLLELSRIGRLMNPSQRLSFGEVVTEALENVKGRLDQGRIKVVVADEFPDVYGDRIRLVEVVQNLVDNAAKFMGKQATPRIEIGVLDSDSSPVFFVRDNGQGIATEYHQKVFGLFETLQAGSEGTGIGLALVKRIVEFYNGRVWVKSDGQGQGSTFYFTLPSKPNTDNTERQVHQ